jgi:hypothetical protein
MGSIPDQSGVTGGESPVLGSMKPNIGSGKELMTRDLWVYGGMRGVLRFGVFPGKA